jgi:acyl carrier protein
MPEIRSQVREFILQSFLDGADGAALKDDASLERTHVVDSARALELILFLEETYGFQVDNEEATPENFDTVDCIVRYVERKLQAG